jgi:hypothetical protein
MFQFIGKIFLFPNLVIQNSCIKHTIEVISIVRRQFRKCEVCGLVERLILCLLFPLDLEFPSRSELQCSFR